MAQNGTNGHGGTVKDNGPATPPKPVLSAAAKLRALLARPDEILVCPGVYDGFTARIALKAGFQCLYMVRRPIVCLWKRGGWGLLFFRLSLLRGTARPRHPGGLNNCNQP